MYKLMANPHYIKRDNLNLKHIYDDILFMKLKERYKDLEQDDFMNILNLIDNYYKNKIVQSTIEDIIDECIFGIQNKDETRLIERVPR